MSHDTPEISLGSRSKLRLARVYPRASAALGEILAPPEVPSPRNSYFRLARACLEQKDNPKPSLSQRARVPQRHKHSIRILTPRDTPVKIGATGPRSRSLSPTTVTCVRLLLPNTFFDTLMAQLILGSPSVALHLSPSVSTLTLTRPTVLTHAV